ncbi:hypothetical protein [Beijerinckia mobilis]|uniref:hypothetical protein n=1 Tax=Beijerinckia mobilis TaxID=231434 RepID=UPI0006923329|nr:hypothetical protein [Beijerinckia mobilis]
MRGYDIFRISLTRALRPLAVLVTILAVAAIGLDLFASAAFARPLTPAERRVMSYNGIIPACDDPLVFRRIQGLFQAREAEFWSTGLLITGFDDVRETGYRTIGEDYIPRRYCWAHVMLNDNKPREVSYALSQDQGWLGMDVGVEWCIIGLDRSNGHGANCQNLQP